MQSTEHRFVGDAARATSPLVPHDDSGAITVTLTSDDGLEVTLTYGQVVALGGDFYATDDLEPISSAVNPSAAFLDAFSTLRNADRDELSRILAIMEEEQSAVAPHGLPVDGDDPAAAFAALGHTLDYQWNAATGGSGWGPIGMQWRPGRYAATALRNMDHFGEDAALAYRVGHEAACREAAVSRDLGRALAMNAHADHFLTDLFASGHLRTPRRLLDETGWSFPGMDSTTVGALVALTMHDEENAIGLVVTSTAHPEPWTAVGDGHVLAPEHRDHFDRAVAAVQQSVDEVIAAAQTGAVGPATALDHRPGVTPDTYPPTGGPSIAPMLVAAPVGVGAVAQMRHSRGCIPYTGCLGGTDCYQYTPHFSAVEILSRRVASMLWPTN